MYQLGLEKAEGKSWLKTQHKKKKDHGIWLHHFMANRSGKSGNSDRLYFLGLQNYCGWWLQPWNYTTLLLGRKAMTNLDSVLKSRDITLPTKVSIVKAMAVFPASCTDVSWTIKKAKRRKLDAFWTVVLEKTLESPLDYKEIKPVHPKGNQPQIFTGRTDAKVEALILWAPDVKRWLNGKDPDAGTVEGTRKWEQQRMRWLDSTSASMDVNLSKLQEIVKERGARCAAVNRVSESDTA